MTIPENAISIVKSHVGNIEGIFRQCEVREDGIKWIHILYPLSVISSVTIEEDGKKWLHVSFAHPKRMPDYNEITMVKERFIGEDKYAMMVFPKKDFHVNIHPYCLHLWHCIDGHPLPEFSGIVSNSRTL
jgi:hypothetical protein